MQMIDKSERLLSFQKADLRECTFETKSPMPSFEDQLNAQDLADVVAYLGDFKLRRARDAEDAAERPACRLAGEHSHFQIAGIRIVGPRFKTA